MWRIEEHRRIDKQLSGSVPREILKWKDIVVISGPAGLRAIKGFHDEALVGEWKGYRASRLGDRWRDLSGALRAVLVSGSACYPSRLPEALK